jgi:hypothetical protein
MTGEAGRVGLDILKVLPVVLIVVAVVGTRRRRDREGAMNAPLRDEIAARVVFETALDHVSFVGEGGFAGTLGYWISSTDPARLVVGTDAFVISSFSREFAFRGCESSIALSQEPSRMVRRDYVIITGGSGDQWHEVAISRNRDLQEIWMALAGTGAATSPPQAR